MKKIPTHLTLFNRNNPTILTKGLLLLALFLFIIPIQQTKAQNTLLWEISGKELTKPSYIFGTYHFADKGFIDTMKIVNEKLKSADAVVGEVIMDAKVAMKLMPFMMLKDGNTLDKLFSAEEYKSIDDYLKQFKGYSLKMFNSMKPIVVQTIIIELTSPKTFTANNPAIDGYFQKYATDNQKKVEELETVEDQATILFGMPIERQKRLLLNSIKNAEKNKQQSLKLYQYYITQDLQKLEKLFADNDDYSKEEMDQLLKNRNLKWIAKLPELMKDRSLFIAVGAGHLLGKNGLIKGLQTKGYTVKLMVTN